MCSHEKVGGGSDGPVPLELLEREICELAAQIHAQTCRWLQLVGEYDAREGWAQWGARSCAQWVAMNCAIAPGAAREQVRVARRLRELPLVREAFAAGQLSYSKVRAITRVGEPRARGRPARAGPSCHRGAAGAAGALLSGRRGGRDRGAGWAAGALGGVDAR